MIEFIICDDNKTITEKIANTISDIMMKNKLVELQNKQNASKQERKKRDY